MGFFDWLAKKILKKEKRAEESSELKKTLERRSERIENHDKRVVALTQLVESEQPVYSPPVEHPLLTIQDRISKLEETYRGLNEKISSIDRKIATKGDMDEIRALMNEDIVKGDKILLGIDNISQKITNLQERKGELEKKIKGERRELEKELIKIEKELELLECDQKILKFLEKAELSSIELTQKMGFTRQYIWTRLKELQKAGFVESVRRGRQNKYRLIRNIT